MARAPYTDLLRGKQLLHADMAPHDVLVDDRGAHLIDWTWPKRAAFASGERGDRCW